MNAEKRKSIQGIMSDQSLTPAERHRQVQALMSSSRNGGGDEKKDDADPSPRVMSAVSAFASRGSSGGAPSGGASVSSRSSGGGSSSRGPGAHSSSALDDKIAAKLSASSSTNVSALSASTSSVRSNMMRPKKNLKSTGEEEKREMSVDAATLANARVGAFSGTDDDKVRRKTGWVDTGLEQEEKREVGGAGPPPEAAAPRVGAFAGTKEEEDAIRNKEGWVDDRVFEEKESEPESESDESDDEDEDALPTWFKNKRKADEEIEKMRAEQVEYEKNERERIEMLRKEGKLGPGAVASSGDFDKAKEKAKEADNDAVAAKMKANGIETGKAVTGSNDDDPGLDKSKVGAYREKGKGGKKKGFFGRKKKEDDTVMLDADVEAAINDEDYEKPFIEKLCQGGIAVGVCLIVIVALAVTIPVVLISKDDPAPPPVEEDPNAPTMAPTLHRLPFYSDIFSEVELIAGGSEILLDVETPQAKALNWIVYEDPLELHSLSDNLQQRFTLMVIYFSAGPWTPKEGGADWGDGVHECEWDSVTCTDRDILEEEWGVEVMSNQEGGGGGFGEVVLSTPKRVVTELRLQQRLVSGAIPPEFGLLRFLRALDLRDNEVDGPIPDAVYKLTNLETLWMEQNKVTGTIDDKIAQLTRMKNLALNNNEMSGALPAAMKELTELKELYLHTQKKPKGFTGNPFDTLLSLPNLELADIANNEFDGTIPREISRMKSLKTLVISGNSFEGSIPTEIGDMTLERFEASMNKDLNGRIPDEIGNLVNLTRVVINTCDLSGNLTTTLGNLEKLTYLDLSTNDITGEIPTEMGEMTELSTLILFANDLEGEIPPELGNLDKLRYLILQENDLQGEVPWQICNLRAPSGPLGDLRTDCGEGNKVTCDCCTQCYDG